MYKKGGSVLKIMAHPVVLLQYTQMDVTFKCIMELVVSSKYHVMYDSISLTLFTTSLNTFLCLPHEGASFGENWHIFAMLKMWKQK